MNYKDESGGNTSETLYQEALGAGRSLVQLEKLYMLLRNSGLKDTLPSSVEVIRSDRLLELIEQMRKCENELDWELTGEILRLKDLIQERATEFARVRYGIAAGGHIRLPSTLSGLPDKLKVKDVTVIDEAPHELRVTGNPVRTDGTLLTELIELLIGPDGVKVRIASQIRRDKLRSRVNP
jgi:hypothetical protein